MKTIDDVLTSLLVHHKKHELSIVYYDKGLTLITEDQKLTDLYIVLEGKMRISRNYENGKRLLVSVSDGFTLLGDIEYVRNRNAVCTCEALSDVKLIKVPFNELRDMYGETLGFYKFLLNHTSEKLVVSENRKSLTIVYPVESRVASYLLSHKDEDDKVYITSLYDMSDSIGTSYRHLQRILRSFIDLDYIDKSRVMIHIKDEKKLFEVAGGNLYER